MTETATTIVGSRVRRLDVDDKLTGKARYATDLRLPGMLYGKIVRSDRPHARIVRIDTNHAAAVPGVETVLCGAVGNRFGAPIKDQTLFAVEKVRHVGEPVAAIAADSEATAEYAAGLIEIEYEDLPAVFDPIAALEPGAPLVHEEWATYAAPETLIRRANVCSQVLLERGDVAAVFARADHIVEGTYAAHSVHQSPMEPRAAVAEVDARGQLTIRSSNQHPFGIRQEVHDALGLPHGDIRVIAETVGGGFGAKVEASLEYYAAVLARATGRPVRVVNTREEDLAYGNPRHPMLMHLRTALSADGTILGREAKAVMDAGAFSGGSPLLAGVAAMLIPGPYHIPNLKVEVLAVYTNNPNFGAYRGPTGPQTVFAVESHTDAIARELGMDAVAFRFKNVLRDGDTGHSGQPLTNVGMQEVLTKAAEAIGWGTANSPSASGLRRGKGLACGWWLTTAGSSGCSVQMNEDGTVAVQTGATEIGTGSVMAGLAQIVAEELGVRYDDVRLIWGDTAATPMDAGAQGSRTLFNMGRAAQRAAQAAKAELLRRAAEILEAAEADLEVRDGRVTVRGVPDRGISYRELVAGQMWSSEPVLGKGAFVVEPTPYDAATLKGSLFPAFNAPSYHCHAAEVEIDPETGQTRVVDFVVVQDVGFAVNPTGVEGQMQGGAVQGIGYALLEELVFEEGRVTNANLALYKVPTTVDVPPVRTIIVEASSEHGPYGAKGVGEPPVVLPPAAVANAVAAATGIPLRATPLTPERVLRVMREGEKAAALRVDPVFDLKPGDVLTATSPDARS
jgi:CO/xanthine dehydrogenase Mo-binding subunit